MIHELAIFSMHAHRSIILILYSNRFIRKNSLVMPKPSLVILLFSLFSLAAEVALALQPSVQREEAGLHCNPKSDGIQIHAYFSPQGGCTEAVIQAVAGAKKSVLVQAYSFTSAAIARALVYAKKRGLDVQVILDRSQRTEIYSSAPYLIKEGIPVWIDKMPKIAVSPLRLPSLSYSRIGIAHNKVMLIDGVTVITGSFNFSKAAEIANAENLLIISQDPELAKAYTANWKTHLAHSVRYKRGKPQKHQRKPIPSPHTFNPIEGFFRDLFHSR